MTADLVIKNSRIVTPRGVSDPGLGVAAADGKIAAIGTDDDLPDAVSTVDAQGNYLAPGVIDCHIHTRSPGYERA